ncbi:hypothetical protein ANCDUO_03877 [Ancylostoma duodenale]|uniref:Uncharacterized protein n=1 Tax=Ancylostoma duodenale TaxID=51022 RepID=A0A0C2GW87_9BILA|nr:hypothetical protein ANCDUO_03877 [Ancylostoma duodenale]
MTLYLILLACIIKSSKETFDASVRALKKRFLKYASEKVSAHMDLRNHSAKGVMKKRSIMSYMMDCM